MSRDVYAGDNDLNDRAASSEQAPTVCIQVHADADPDVLLRVASQLNLFNCAPASFTLRRHGEEVVMEMTMTNCTDFLVDMVCRKLAQLTCVNSVERGSAPTE